MQLKQDQQALQIKDMLAAMAFHLMVAVVLGAVLEGSDQTAQALLAALVELG